MKSYCGLALLVVGIFGAAIGLPAKEPAAKASVDEIIAGHLASIGTPEARAAVNTRLARGKVQMKIVQGGVGTLDGGAFLLGEGKKFRVAMPFTYADYWGEQLLFDGSKMTIGFSQPAARSTLGQFLIRAEEIFKEGLVGGVLSPSWALLDLPGRQPKLSYSGLKGVDGRDAHQIVYHMKKGQGEEVITLYFDPETFRHIKTSYEVTISSGMVAKANDSAKQVEGHFMLEEIFSDFAKFDGLTLPQRWTIRTNIEANRSMVREWNVALEGIIHNQPIDPKTWVLDQPK